MCSLLSGLWAGLLTHIVAKNLQELLKPGPLPLAHSSRNVLLKSLGSVLLLKATVTQASLLFTGAAACRGHCAHVTQQPGSGFIPAPATLFTALRDWSRAGPKGEITPVPRVLGHLYEVTMQPQTWQMLKT